MVACRCGTQIPKLAMLALPQMHIPFGSSVHFLMALTGILSCQVCLKQMHIDLVNTQ